MYFRGWSMDGAWVEYAILRCGEHIPKSHTVWKGTVLGGITHCMKVGCKATCTSAARKCNEPAPSQRSWGKPKEIIIWKNTFFGFSLVSPSFPCLVLLFSLLIFHFVCPWLLSSPLLFLCIGTVEPMDSFADCGLCHRLSPGSSAANNWSVSWQGLTHGPSH